MTRDQAQSPGPTLYTRVVENGHVCPSRLTDALRVTEVELAASMGLSIDAVRQHEDSALIQRRLHDVVEILDLTTARTGSDVQAFAWYRCEPLPSYGNRTAAELVGEGLSDAVKTYLYRIDIGGFA